MLDRLEAAMHRYELICPKAGEDKNLERPTELSQWLVNDVSPVVEQLVQRFDFCGLARWAIDNLAPGAQTEARRFIDVIDRRLVESAKGIARLASGSLPRRALQTAAGGAASARRKKLRPVPAKTATPPTASPPTVAEFVATRPWHDLVSTSDFFHPAAELNLKDRAAWLGANSHRLQLVEFMPYHRPHWTYPGDHVTRCMLVRMSYWRDHLQQFRAQCENQANPGSGELASWASLQGPLREIQQDIQRLEALCLQGPEVPLRQACMTLVQIYAGFYPQGDFSWLGPVGKLSDNAAILRYRVERQADLRVSNAVAAALSEVATLYRSDLDPDLVIAERAQRNRLVLVYGVGRHELHWDQELVDIDWGKRGRAWTLLVAMAEKAKRGQGVDAANDLDVSLKDAKCDLMRILPRSLGVLITARKGVYKLNVSADQIYVACFDQEDRLSEVI